jgi:transcriptional regulator with XRE-family HTH domain
MKKTMKTQNAKQPNAKSPNLVDVEVGRRIRSRRLAKGISQTALGRPLGVTFQQVQKYEKGVNRVGAGRLQQIAELLDVPVSFFFGATDGDSRDTKTVMGFIDTAHAVRLMRAYSRLENRKVQYAVVDLVERMAERKK